MAQDNSPPYQTCGNCICYYDGFCRHDPPRALMPGDHPGSYVGLPAVEPLDWCRKWEEAPE